MYVNVFLFDCFNDHETGLTDFDETNFINLIYKTHKNVSLNSAS